MDVSDLRQSLALVRDHLRSLEIQTALEELDRVIEALNDRMLTTTEAARFLDVKSVNTLKALVQRAGLRVERHGNRMMIPISELERLQQSPLLTGIRESDRMHDGSSELGNDVGLSEDDLEALEDQRETVPWSKNCPTVPA